MSKAFRTGPLGRWVAASAVVMLSVAACGGADSGDAGPAGEEGGEPITLGIILPHTGVNAPTGELMTAGAETAIEEINAAGGVAGRQLKLELYDSQGTPEAGVRAFNQFVSDGLDYGIIGYSNVVTAVAPLASREDVLLLNGGSPSLNTKQLGEHMVATLGGVETEMRCGAKYAVDEWDVKKAGFVYADVAVNYQGVQWFAEELESLGGSTAGSESVQQGSTTDFRSVLSRILSQDPDLLYLYTYGPDPGAITQQARQLGYKGKIMGYSGIPVPAFIDVAGPEAAEGARATTGYFDPAGTDAATKRYIESWRKYQAADVDPAGDLSFYHATLYDSVHIFAEAAEHLVEGGGDLSDPRQLQDAIYEVGEFQDMVTGTAVFEEGNAIPVKPLGVVEVQDGSWALIDRLDC